jgi:Peptidase family M28
MVSLCDDVDSKGLMRTIEAFGQWEKLSGSDGEMTSLQMIRSHLDSYGFRTRILHHDAYISLPGRSRVSVGNIVPKSITHSFSQSSSGLTAELVYVGAGADADFADREVRGKIVVVDGIATPPVSLRASRAGAAGQLHVSPHEHLHEMCISPVWGSPPPDKLADLPSTVVCSVLPSFGDPLRERLKSGETIVAILEAEVDTGWRPIPILEAGIGDQDGPFVLFSGHHDTWYYGVMDNGSANAAMMEVARLCATKQAEWKRGLRLCFWSGHSHGRYAGSTWYVDNHFDELDRFCVAHLNVDSLGARGADVLTNVGSMSCLYGLAAEAIEAHSGQRLIGKRMSRGADQSFNGVGLPALFGDLSEPEPTPVGPHCWWWHTPDDLADKIDEATQVRDTRIYVHALWRLLTDVILPLDFAATARSLLTELEQTGGSTDVMTLKYAVQELETRASALRAVGAEVDRINAALMRVSRVLVPLDYTSGDRFAHDPALGLPAWPVLEPLRTLAKMIPESDAARFQAVAAVRAINRVLAAVREANVVLEGVSTG